MATYYIWKMIFHINLFSFLYLLKEEERSDRLKFKKHEKITLYVFDLCIVLFNVRIYKRVIEWINQIVICISFISYIQLFASFLNMRTTMRDAEQRITIIIRKINKRDTHTKYVKYSKVTQYYRFYYWRI